MVSSCYKLAECVLIFTCGGSSGLIAGIDVALVSGEVRDLLSTESVATILRDNRILEQCYDAWRVVSPRTRQVIYNSPEAAALINTKRCFDCWQTGTPCVNCISMRAYIESRVLLKFEYANESLYMITAVPTELADEIVVVELLQNVTGRGSFENFFGQTADVTKLACTISQLNEAVVKDELTQVFNRRYIGERLMPDIIAARMAKQSITAIMVDIDNFKKVNDTFGHLAGDEVLKAFAGLLAGSLRKTDWVARYGGEEFLIVLRGASPDAVPRIVESLREKVEKTCIETAAGKITVTASFGVCIIKDLLTETIDEIIAQADSNLYKAKQGGKNLVVCS